jgi:hypothetical protein
MVAVYHNYVIFQDVTPFEVSVKPWLAHPDLISLT